MKQIKNREQADQMLIFNRSNRASGLCNCGAFPQPGKKSCTNCLRAMRTSNSDIRAYKKIEGECSKTGCENPVRVGHTVCDICRATIKIKRRAYRGDKTAIKEYRQILKARLAQRVALGGIPDDRRTINALARLEAV